MRIGNEADAKGVVSKYINGTRSRHGKIASIIMDEKPAGPDKKGTWTINGSYVTEDGEKQEFTASVTSRGEVVMINHAPSDKSGKRPSKPSR